ncbi:MAG: hypothetical protein QM737_21640 [Ferruginibacter sp.]
MKKILFIAFAVVSFSNLASAQSKERNAAMTPAPSEAEIARDTKIKAASVPQTKDQLKKTNEGYKQAGLTPSQMQTMKEFDLKRAEVEKNTQLTPEEKRKEVMALEAERQLALKRAMGDAKYQKYLTQNPAPAPAQKTTKTKAN